MLDNWIGLHVDDDTGIPLAFAIRSTKPDSSVFRESNYKSLEHQYACRTRLYDNNGKPFGWTRKVQRKVWNILYKIFQGHPAYEYMRPFKNQPDGVGAYQNMRNHYLGPNNVNNMAADLEKEYNNLSYSQETNRWNFEKYVNKHVELHNIAQTLVPHGYGAADEGSRVRKLISGIKTSALDTIKGQILGSPRLSSSFDDSVCLFKDFIFQTKALSMGKHSGAANVAGVVSGGKKRKNGKGKGTGDKRQRGRIANVNVQDRYYTSKEYNKLSRVQKQALREKRMARTSNGSDEKGQAKVSQVVIEEVQEKEEAIITNRNNPALTRRS
jgi:hypothetical protein